MTIGDQNKENAGNEKWRAFYFGAVEVTGGLTRNFCRCAVATLVIYAVIILAGLLTADPDTTTFRDFLIALRNPAIWSTSVMLAIMWVGLNLLLFPRQPHSLPMGTAMAAVAIKKASGSGPTDPV